MWQQIIHGSIRSHFHSTTQRQRIPWSVAVNGSLYQPSWKACLITHSNTTVPRVLGFPNGHQFTDQSGTATHATCFSMRGVQMPSCCKSVELFYSCFCFVRKFIKRNIKIFQMKESLSMFNGACSPLTLNYCYDKFVIDSLQGGRKWPRDGTSSHSSSPFSLEVWFCATCLLFRDNFSIWEIAKYGTLITFFPFKPRQWIFFKP